LAGILIIGLDAYIIALGIIGFIIIYPYGNMPSVDAYFFGVSASTESGLNTLVPQIPILSPCHRAGLTSDIAASMSKL